MATISIVWSGFWWLSAALYCAKNGHEVHVFEKNEQLGGRASIYEKNWFRWDMWPSRYLMPDLFEDFFKEFGYEVDDLFELKKLSPSYRIFFKDSGKQIDVFDEVEKNRDTFEAIEPGSTDNLKKYLKKAKYQYEVAMKDFVPKNYDSITDFFTWRMLTEGIKLNVFSTIGTYVKRYFKTPEMQKIIQYPMVFLWSPPYETPAIYNLMTYVDFGMGVRYPKGGIHSLITAMVDIGKKLWVQYHTNSEVNQILVDPLPNSKDKVGGIKVNNTFFETDIVISNGDMARTETQLLDTPYQSYDTDYRKSRKLAPSAFLVYLGVKWGIKNIEHHTLIFAEDWKQNNKEIFKTRQAPTDPSFYICCPSKTDDSIVPPGHENLFLLVPFPPGVSMSEDEKQSYKDKILQTTEDVIGEKFVDRIVHERIFTVDDFRQRYHAYEWTALGIAHTFRQTAIFRPNNVSKKVAWLYYAWAYTNPGIGMPMCLISGKLAYERIKADLTD